MLVHVRSQKYNYDDDGNLIFLDFKIGPRDAFAHQSKYNDDADLIFLDFQIRSRDVCERKKKYQQ